MRSTVGRSRRNRAPHLIAPLFSLGIGLVIALLPVSARAAEAAAPSLELLAFKIVPATPSHPEQLVAANEARAGDQLEYRAVYRKSPTSPPYPARPSST